jgi:hypothetical protein
MMNSIKKSKNLKDNYACNLLFVSTLYVNEIWKKKKMVTMTYTIIFAPSYFVFHSYLVELNFCVSEELFSYPHN